MNSRNSDFLQTTLGRTGRRVFRLGLGALYRPGERAVREGIEAGINFLLWHFTDTQMTRALREVLPAQREKLVIAAGCTNLGEWFLRRGVESALRRLRTDYVDVFLIGWVGTGKLRPKSVEILQKYREEGRIRHIGISTHERKYAGELVRQGLLDVLMMRYNAAHRGAEQEIFPHLAASNPGVVSYTATRWTYLLRRPRGWPENGRVPTAGECYRFVLSNPHVHVCLTAPTSAEQLRENLEAVEHGPLDEGGMNFMREFGDAVHSQRRFFL
ncbi:MAG: aldo/keto reductase [Acidobacteria bacterium]|nr:aldo/keto reductase [Acidobacteriota bacterium]